MADSPMLTFLPRALQSMVRELKKGQDTLKEKLEGILTELNAGSVRNSMDGNAVPPSPAIDPNIRHGAYEQDATAEKFVEPFLLACESGNPRLMVTALDVMQKLVAYGYLRGTSKMEYKSKKAKEPRQMTQMEAIIECMCECAENGDPLDDQGILLQIIKALLTVVTSSTCNVHENSLLSAVRTCYNIHLESKTAVNQMTAKATLTQMLNIVFNRMEAQSTSIMGDKAKGAKERRSLSISNREMKAAVKEAERMPNQDRQNTDEGDEETQQLAIATKAVQEITRQVSQLSTVKDEQAANGNDSGAKDSSGDDNAEDSVKENARVIVQSVLMRIMEDAGVIMPAQPVNEEGYPAGKFGWCIVCKKSANNYCIETRDPVCSVECKAQNLEMIKKAQKNNAEGASGSNMDSLTGGEFGLASQVAASNVFSNVFQKDAFLLFRALCRLAHRSDNSESIALRSKVLSMELLLSVLENSGPVFRTADKFVYAVKQYLCLLLPENCVSPVPSVFRLSLSIFVALLANFKNNLKTEIGGFFKIFLFSLESNNSTFHQKLNILQVFYKICRDPQTLVDIYLNYDCDLESPDIFARMVVLLSKIAQGSVQVDVSPAQEGRLRMLGLECFVAMSQSMTEWMHLQAGTNEEPSGGSAGDSGNDENDGDDAPVGSPRQVKKSISFATDSEAEGNSSQGASSVQRKSRISEIEARKLQKLAIDEGVRRFNISAKKGMKYILEKNIVNNTHDDIVAFLKTAPGLNKKSIGEYLGEKDNMPILANYIDGMNFHGVHIDDALRMLFAGFFPEGEAQKVDRLVEKFAERFCICNPDIFEKADSAYMLAFLIMMLNTDAHNQNIKVHMKKEDFRSRYATTDGESLSDEYLDGIYDRVSSNEIKTQDDETTQLRPAGLVLNPRERLQMFREESKAIVKSSQQNFREKIKKRTVFHTAYHVEHVRSMFSSVWAPLLASLSVLLERSEDDKEIELCLEGFRHCIHIACSFIMETERNAFVTSLTKFTHLNTVREMKQKNIDSIKILIYIAEKEGNGLGSAWEQVLTSISQLERLQLIGTGAKAEASYIADSPQHSAANAPKGQRPSLTNKDSMTTSVEEFNSAQIFDQIDVTSIDKVFANSTSLKPEAIVDFVKHLCAVSIQEIEGPKPRIFSLQKIVEIADFNMGRIRFVWSEIWFHLSTHFMTVGCHDNRQLAMYAIDSLRQLSIKFLEKDELSNFQFQKGFLKPFEQILLRNRHVEIRELVVRCLSQMVQSKSANIKSGWKSMFSAFKAAANDTSESIISIAFAEVENMVTNKFELITENFVDCVNSLVVYGRNSQSEEISLRAVELIRFCSQRVIQELETSTKDDQGGSSNEAVNNDDKQVQVWFPILTGISRIISDPRLAVRTKALEAQFDLLKVNGGGFSESVWGLIFNGVLFPIFDDVRHLGTNMSETEKEWLQTTCLNALRALVSLFCHFYDKLNFLLGDVSALLMSCMNQDNEALAKIGVTCFLQLVFTSGERFDNATWRMICKDLRTQFGQTTPHMLVRAGSRNEDDEAPYESVTRQSSEGQQALAKMLNAGGPEVSEDDDGNVANYRRKTSFAFVPASEEGGNPKGSPWNFERVRCNCVVQLLLIQAVKDIIFAYYEVLEFEHVSGLLEALRYSYDFAHKFNNNMALRLNLRKIAAMPQLPNLLKQETNAMLVYLQILFKLCEDNDKADPELTARRIALAEPLLADLCSEFLEQYIAKEHTLADQQSQAAPAPTGSPSANGTSPSQDDADLNMLSPIVVSILKGFLSLREDLFKNNIKRFYKPFTDMFTSNRMEIRTLLRDIFQKRLGERLVD